MLSGVFHKLTVLVKKLFMQNLLLIKVTMACRVRALKVGAERTDGRNSFEHMP